MTQPAPQGSALYPTSEDLCELDFLVGAVVPSARGGRKRNPGLQVDYLRELNAGDLEFILNPPEQGTAPPIIKSLRHSHHLLARMLAEGHKAVRCSEVTGYAQSRISILQRDPAFAELVQYYKGQVKEQYLDVHSRLATLGMDTIEELHERLGTEPEQFSNKDLFKLAELVLDRSSAPRKVLDQGQSGKPSAPAMPMIQINFVKSRNADAAEPEVTINGQAEPPRSGGRSPQGDITLPESLERLGEV